MPPKRKVVLEPGAMAQDAQGVPLAVLAWATYRVVQAVNVLTPALHAEVEAGTVQKLIDSGIEVVIIPKK